VSNTIYGFVNVVTRKLRAGFSSGACETFAVIMKWPNRERPVPAFFKTVELGIHQKLMVNEILANKIAHLRNLPIVDTCPCACRREFLLSNGASGCLIGRESTPFVSGIASLDPNPHHVKQRLFPGPKLNDELLRWRHCQEVAVFDELICNPDRTIFNLLRIGPGEFLIIDHDQALGGTDWTPELLISRLTKPLNANHLADLIISSQDQVGTYRLMKIAEEYVKFQLPRSLADTLAIECQIEHDLAALIVDLLNQRMKMLPGFLQKYVTQRQLELRQFDE
jgi:hypothetical protein